MRELATSLGCGSCRERPGGEWSPHRIGPPGSVYVPVLLRTTDAGRNWTAQDYPDLKLLPHSVQFADAIHGIALELNATLFTRDGGRTWKRSRYCSGLDQKQLRRAESGSDTFAATTVHLLDRAFGWWSVEGDLFRTTDGGETWCRLPSIQFAGEDVRIGQIRFANRARGWAVPTQLGRFDPLPLFETRDGGSTWAPVRSALKVPVIGCSVVSAATVYCWDHERLYRIAWD